ncbi:MAG: ribosome silencing factor [Planctomycetota bacterium]
MSSNASESSQRTSPQPGAAPDDSTRDMAIQLAERLDQKQAADIRILDVSGPLVIADYFVVATVQSTRQAQSLAKELDMAHKAARGRRKRNGGTEGEDTNWVLLDFNDIVVHLFLPDAREYYGLESLWADVPRLEFTPTAQPEPEAAAEVRQPTLDGFGAFQPLPPEQDGGSAADPE